MGSSSDNKYAAVGIFQSLPKENSFLRDKIHKGYYFEQTQGKEIFCREIGTTMKENDILAKPA